MVVEPNTANIDRTVGRIDTDPSSSYGVEGVDDPIDVFQSRLFAHPFDWNSMTDLNSEERFIGMFRDDAGIGGDTSAEYTSSAALGAAIGVQLSLGRFPIYIAAGGAGGGTRYYATFAQTDVPDARTWSIRGSTDPNDVGIPSVDLAMLGFMQRNNVRQASLAAVYQNKLVYARGYTYAEPGYPQTDPTTTFRMGSVTTKIVATRTSRTTCLIS